MAVLVAVIVAVAVAVVVAVLVAVPVPVAVAVAVTVAVAVAMAVAVAVAVAVVVWEFSGNSLRTLWGLCGCWAGLARVAGWAELALRQVRLRCWVSGIIFNVKTLLLFIKGSL